jgi:hypothetical protein
LLLLLVLWWRLLQWRLLRQRLLLLLAKSVYSLLQLYLPCSFLLDLLLHDLSSLNHNHLSGHVPLHELKAFIFLLKACQLIFYNGFDFLLRVLVLIILSFGFSVWVLIVVWLLMR